MTRLLIAAFLPCLLSLAACGGNGGKGDAGSSDWSRDQEVERLCAPSHVLSVDFPDNYGSVQPWHVVCADGRVFRDDG